jgi:2-oxoisovalerate dehydrogenase E1 component
MPDPTVSDPPLRLTAEPDPTRSPDLAVERSDLEVRLSPDSPPLTVTSPEIVERLAAEADPVSVESSEPHPVARPSEPPSATRPSEPHPVIDHAGPAPAERELLAQVDRVLAGLDRPQTVDEPNRPPSPLGYAAAGLRQDAGTLVRMFDAQALARWLDVAALRIRPVAAGRHLPPAAGHEGVAAVALALRPDDPALLHPRSTAFFLARAAQAGHPDAVLEVALGLAGAGLGRGDPRTGFGHPALAVVPHTSSLGGHLPRAVGIAWSLGRQGKVPERLRVPLAWPDDALAVVAFDEVVANHSTATGAVNSACWASWRRIPLPLLLVCEDEAAVSGPPAMRGWSRALFDGRAGLEYVQVDGADPIAALGAARWAAGVARDGRRPVVLHLVCPPTGGRGTARPGVVDPLAVTMRALVDGGVLGPDQVRERWEAAGERVAEAMDRARGPRHPRGVTGTTGPAVRSPGEVAARVGGVADAADRNRVFAGRLPEDEGPLTVAETINRTLLDLGARDARVLVLGADLAVTAGGRTPPDEPGADAPDRAGGWTPTAGHGTTRGLRRLGASRVVDAITDERSVLGLALGAGVSGLLPIVELQDVSGLFDAQDQLRGQAATLRALSRDAFRNPLVIRVPSLGHPSTGGVGPQVDHALAALRDIPDLVVACPAHPSDVPPLLRTCLAAAEVDGVVAVVVEPVDLYHERDMLTPGDGAWLASYPPSNTWRMGHVPVGRAAVWGAGSELTIATFGSGLRPCLQASSELAAQGIDTRVVDLRWLEPLPLDDVLREARATGRLLVVDETRRAGGLAEGLLTAVLEAGFTGRVARLCAEDSLVAGGDPTRQDVVGVRDVVAAGRSLATAG